MPSVFDQLNVDQAPTSPSPKEQAKKQAEIIVQHMLQSSVGIFNMANQGYNLLWKPGNDMTPAMVAEALGANGLEVIQAHAAVCALLKEIAPSLGDKLLQVPPWATIVPEVDGANKPTGKISIVST